MNKPHPYPIRGFSHRLWQQFAQALANIREGLREHSCRLSRIFARAFASIRVGFLDHSCEKEGRKGGIALGGGCGRAVRTRTNKKKRAQMNGVIWVLYQSRMDLLGAVSKGRRGGEWSHLRPSAKDGVGANGAI